MLIHMFTCLLGTPALVVVGSYAHSYVYMMQTSRDLIDEDALCVWASSSTTKIVWILGRGLCLIVEKCRYLREETLMKYLVVIWLKAFGMVP